MHATQQSAELARPVLSWSRCLPPAFFRPTSRPHQPLRLPGSLLQEALLDCVKRVVFQENAPMGQPANLRFLIGRSQEAGVVDK